jgi:hypothetical protein
VTIYAYRRMPHLRHRWPYLRRIAATIYFTHLRHVISRIYAGIYASDDRRRRLPHLHLRAFYLRYFTYATQRQSATAKTTSRRRRRHLYRRVTDGPRRQHRRDGQDKTSLHRRPRIHAKTASIATTDSQDDVSDLVMTLRLLHYVQTDDEAKMPRR